jgi:hypothetical protein
MRREMVDKRVLYREQVEQKDNPQLSSLVFISQDPELNASISRYFKYVHNITITTFQSPITSHQSPLTNHQSPLTTHPSPITSHQSTNHLPPITSHQSPLVVQNEVFIDGQVYGIYPFWFAFGMKNNIRVYGFTYETTDWQNNLLDWQDFLGLQWLNRYQDTIDHEKVPYFDSARSSLYGVLKPHGDESLYDLAAGFHMTFANALQYIGRLKSSGNQISVNFMPDVIEPGIARFRKFLEKEPRHHSFISLLPEADKLFDAVKELGKLVDELEEIDIQRTETMETLCHLLSLIHAQTSSIHSFFLNLETFIPGGP